jgi:hypothetical protein
LPAAFQHVLHRLLRIERTAEDPAGAIGAEEREIQAEILEEITKYGTPPICLNACDLFGSRRHAWG